MITITDRLGRQLSFLEILTKIASRLKNILLEFEIYCLHLVGCLPSHHIRRFFYRLAGIKIGRGSTIHMGARFYNPINIQIGEDTIIGENAVLDGRNNLIIGNHVAVASEVMLYNSEHDINSAYFEAKTSPIIIKDYVFIGPRSIILPGVTVGKGAVIAAGAVVTRNVAPFTIVGGVPAEVIGMRKNRQPNYRLGRASWFR